MPDKALANVIDKAAANALTVIARDPTSPINQVDVPAMLAAVNTAVDRNPQIAEIGKTVAEAVTPVIWYQDRTIIASIVGLIASVLGAVWGIQLAAEHQQLLINLLPALLGGLASVFVAITRVTSRVKPVVATSAQVQSATPDIAK